jgi:GT2 family glycosyltransferase
MYSAEPLDLSIVTVNWNVSDKLQRCIDSAVETMKNIRYEMFIIDNDSTDVNFKDIIQKYSNSDQLKFIKNSKNEGSVVINKVMDKMMGRYILIVGPDTILKEKAVQELIRFMDETKGAGAASAKLLNPDGSPQMYFHKFWDLPMVFFIATITGSIIDKMFFKCSKHKHYLQKDMNIERIEKIEQCSGACLIFRRDLVFKDGFIIDPIFPFYFNDDDICERIVNQGYKIYFVPNAIVIHDQQSSYKKVNSYWKKNQSIIDQIHYFQKYHQDEVGLLKTLNIIDSFVKIIVNPFLRVFQDTDFDTMSPVKFKEELKIIGHIFQT